MDVQYLAVPGMDTYPAWRKQVGMGRQNRGCNADALRYFRVRRRGWLCERGSDIGTKVGGPQAGCSSGITGRGNAAVARAAFGALGIALDRIRNGTLDIDEALG